MKNLNKLRKLFIVILFITLINSCFKKEKLNIYPLSPSTSWGHLEFAGDIYGRPADTVYLRNYIFEGNIRMDSLEIKKSILYFIDTSKDRFTITHKHCQINFYISEFGLNKDFIEGHNNKLSNYMKARIGEFIWLNKKVYEYRIYKNEKTISEYHSYDSLK